MSGQDEHDGQATGQATKRQKTFVVYTTMDGQIRIRPDEESYLGTISPFFDPASLASAASTSAIDHQNRLICAPSAFIVRCIALVTAFVEWQQLDEEGPDDDLKREYRARVAAMVRALTACPFDQTYALRLGMTERLRDMEATLEDHDGALVRCGFDGLVGPAGHVALTTEKANRLVGVTFSKDPGPSETRARAVLCAFFAVKYRGDSRSKDKFRPIALCPHHFEIRHDAEVYDEHNGDRVLVVRGRDSPHGCAIRRIEVVHGLASSAVIDLAEIERRQDERRRIAFKDTATVLGIMRIQKARLQTMMQNVAVPDPNLVLLVEFLDAVALELASV